jgi:hypothetical protein
MVYILWTIDETNRRKLEGVYRTLQDALDAQVDLDRYFEDTGWAGLSTRVEQTVVQGSLLN